MRRATKLQQVETKNNIFFFFSLSLFVLVIPHLLFLFSSLLYFNQSVRITTILLMYFEDDYPLRWGFCSWTRPGEPYHPRCNRQEQKEWRGKRQEFHWATTKTTDKSYPHSPPAPPPLPRSYSPLPSITITPPWQPFNLLSVRTARSSSYPPREIHWGVLIMACFQLSLIRTTLNLMRSFISPVSSFLTLLHSNYGHTLLCSVA